MKCKKFSFEENNLTYCFPGREFILSEKYCDISVNNGYFFPFHFILIIHKNGNEEKCTTLILQSGRLNNLTLKKYLHSEKKVEIVEVAFFYESDTDDEKAVLRLDDTGDFHVGLEQYKNWYLEHYGRKICNKFAGKFHLKRMFLYEKFCKASIIKNGEVDVKSILERDREAFGDVDLALLFDIGYDPKRDIRCGNRKPCFLEDSQIEKLKQQIENSSMVWFGYFDPCIIQDDSDWDDKYKNRLKIRDNNQNVCRMWGPELWHPYLNDEEYMFDAAEYVENMQKVLPMAGVYLDEIGNGMQYNYNGYNQILAEAGFVDYLQKNNSDKLWMCEFPPVFEMANQFDIVLSDTKSLLNIYRFILPWIKYVRIIGCDLPLGDNEWEVNKSFFNGEALWLDNDPDNKTWYPENIKKVIRKQYEVLKKYGELIDEGVATPLFQIDAKNILCNRFEKNNQAIMMLINPENTQQVGCLCGEGLKYEVVYGENTILRQKDNWIEVQLEPYQVVAILECR